MIPSFLFPAHLQGYPPYFLRLSFGFFKGRPTLTVSSSSPAFHASVLCKLSFAPSPLGILPAQVRVSPMALVLPNPVIILLSLTLDYSPAIFTLDFFLSNSLSLTFISYSLLVMQLLPAPFDSPPGLLLLCLFSATLSCVLGSLLLLLHVLSSAISCALLVLDFPL